MVSNNDEGIRLYHSNNNTLTNNTVLNNSYGIHLLAGSSNNKIHLNNFINNSKNVCSYSSTNIWNSTSKITYTYNGSTFTNYMGNYWDDYNGTDVDKDGFGDTPYSIDSDKYFYPLMKVFAIYSAPAENIFDTGALENPYPSISGTHNGTIKPNVTIEVSKLYTYPCEGTGGHTKYVWICGNGVNESASWNGYSGDWHNIIFNDSFTLQAGVEYNYTIHTGSYPQIIHEQSKDITGGTITCTSSVDANGKVYTDWIPAIKLYDLQNGGN